MKLPTTREGNGRGQGPARIGALLLPILCVLGACAQITTGSACVAEDDYFIGQRTLSWAPDFAQITHDPLDAIAPVTLEQIRAETQRQFELLGYEFVSDIEASDMTLSFVVATRQEIVRGSYADRHPFWWGVYGEPSVVYYAEPIKEAFLAIDLSESSTNRPLWRGWAEKPVTPSDRADPTPLIESAVASILTELPGAARPEAGSFLEQP